MIQQPYISSFKQDENREVNDFYPTQPEAIRALLEKEEFLKIIWEPACGELHISKELVKNGHIVFNSDIVSRVDGAKIVEMDFLKSPVAFHPFDYVIGVDKFDVVTNPPFKHSEEFVHHALRNVYSRKVAIFEKLTFLETRGRKKRIYDVLPLETVYVMSWRVSIWRNGITQKGGRNMPTAWFVFNKERKQKEPFLRWL